MSFTRTDRSHAAEWWFTIDRTLIAVAIILMMTGLILLLAASPAVAIRKGLTAYHFAGRQSLFMVVGVVIMLAVSLMRPREVRRAGLLVTAIALGLMVSILMSGTEINGARRWVRILDFSFQPSELVKPGFIVLSAWLLSESRGDNGMPAIPIAMGLLGMMCLLLVAQPDVGQTMLIVTVWITLFFLSGQPIAMAGALSLVGFAGVGAAYFAFDHVRQRIDRFLDPASGDTFQVDRARQAFSEGGLLGRGPGEGTIKSVLPDAHTDFVFAVVAEEYGAIACLALLGLFAFIVMRAFARARREPDLFVRLAIIGLALLIGMQALINMGVNVGLLPAKGMTLPFISAGGSSSLSIALTMGFLLALMRHRPGPSRVPDTYRRTKAVEA